MDPLEGADVGAQNEGAEDNSAEGISAEVEARAREMGWVPKEQFRGPEERFIPADEYVRRGEEMLPVVKSENRRLKEQIANLQSTHEQNIEELRASINEFREQGAEQTVETARARRTELAAQIKTAREEGDTELELTLQEEFTELGNVIKNKGKKPDTGTSNGTGGSSTRRENPTVTREMQEFQEANEWFGTDEERTAVAMVAAKRLRQSNPNLKGRPFLDKVAEHVEKIFGGNPARQRPSKVGGGTRSSSDGGGVSVNGKSLSDLPPDAKEAMQKQMKRFVGPNKAFKDEASYQKHYLTQYFR